jgi:hypothetical protein
MLREDFIATIPNCSYVNNKIEKQQNIEDLLNLKDEKYIFACGDVFTKAFESNVEIQWVCKRSFLEITVDKDGSDYYYGVASCINNNFPYYE